MKKKLLTEQDVLNKLQIEDFRQLSKDKVVAFANNIQYMSEEVALKCIEQFPEFANQAGTVVKTIKESCDKIIAHSRESEKEAASYYAKLLDILYEQINKENLTHAQRMEIADKIKSTADAIADLKKHHWNFMGNILNVLAKAAVFCLVACLAVIGIKDPFDKN